MQPAAVSTPIQEAKYLRRTMDAALCCAMFCGSAAAPRGADMKILIARFNHETNTFSPVPTPLEAFDPAYDEDAYRLNLGMRTAMAAFIDLARDAKATVVCPVSATANPSGVVQAQAYDEITERIVRAAPGCDAILLDLHGAMVAESS